MSDAAFPERIGAWRAVKALRYGENPHQAARLYSDGGDSGVANAAQLHGGEMSYLNYYDADAAWRAVSAFDEPTAVIVKHATPCGVASRPTQTNAFAAAFAGDPVSAFGGAVGFNSPVTESTAAAMSGKLFDVIVAPGYEPQALATLKRRKRARVLSVKRATDVDALELRAISGGALAQTPDEPTDAETDWQIASKRAPTAAEMEDLRFAWRCCAFVKSNAIVLAKQRATIGIGAGQPNRVGSVKIAIANATQSVNGAALASDAFFPFPDGVEAAAEAGVGAVIQPGGSIRDKESIAVADRYDMAMILTGRRRFLH